MSRMTAEETRAHDRARYPARREESIARSMAYYAAHKEEVAVRDAKYYVAHRAEHIAYNATHLKESAATQRAYRAAHPEKRASAAAKCAAYYAANPERSMKQSRAWVAANPDGRSAICKKHSAKRRALGFVPLNASFAGCEGHHIDKERVINMPKPLHHSVYHNQYTGQGMAQMNAIAYNFLFKQEVEAALGGKREQLA